MLYPSPDSQNTWDIRACVWAPLSLSLLAKAWIVNFFSIKNSWKYEYDQNVLLHVWILKKYMKYYTKK